MILSDNLITNGKNRYSIPFDLVGETVDIRLTRNTVEAFFCGSRVAPHPRRQCAERDLENLDFLLLLNKAADDREILAKS